MPGPFLRIDPLWFDSCKRPPPVSNHSVFAFWVVAYGMFKSCNCNQAGTFENTRKVSRQWSLFKTVFYFSFLGSFSTASCTNCKHQVSCEVIREEIFQQVCTLLRLHQLKHWGCWKKYIHNPKKIACYSNLSGALWQGGKNERELVVTSHKFVQIPSPVAPLWLPIVWAVSFWSISSVWKWVSTVNKQMFHKRTEFWKYGCWQVRDY